MKLPSRHQIGDDGTLKAQHGLNRLLRHYQLAYPEFKKYQQEMVDKAPKQAEDMLKSKPADEQSESNLTIVKDQNPES